MQLLILMQGVPGSGKSTIANQLTKWVASADSWFYTNGKYNFDATQLPEAHKSCQELVRTYMSVEKSTIAVDNTNIKQIHIEPYLALAKRYGYTVVVIRANGQYVSKHGVPQATIDRMRKEMEVLKV